MLLESAGCELGDLERLVARDGVEGALEDLLRNGVYLTVDEFKGRRPVVRGSTSFRVDPVSLQNPAPDNVRALTSGSRGPRTSVTIDLHAIRDWAVNTRFEFEARGARAWAVARWTVPGGEAVAGILRFYAGSGVPLARWFSPVDPSSPGLHPRYPWSVRLLRWGSRLGGVPVPRPRYVPLENPGLIVRWLARILRTGTTPFLVMYVSSAVRLARAAHAAGVDLSGTHVLGTGEPVTASRRATVRRAGIEIAASYASMEIGPIASGCLTPSAPDNVHVFHDLLALVQPPGEESSARSLFVSTLRPSAPFTMLNVSLGDQAVLARRSCGCLLGEVGWRTHLHGIRSFEKLTAGGMSFLDTDIIRVLEDVLPSRFGGAPTDYQLVEDEEADGRPRVRLFIHPALGPVDPQEASATFLDAIGDGVGPERVMGLAWRGAGLPRVERRPPLATGSGKILHCTSASDRGLGRAPDRHENPARRAPSGTAPGRRRMSTPYGNREAGSVVLRPLSSREDYRQCLALQDRTWGERFTERASVAMLMGTQRVGGVAAGAFDATQELLGFVFGFNGVREGRLAHWSYMLAVQRRAQGRGLGRRLKVYQREILLASGIEIVYWTYDPLVAVNAHLNLSRLGARAIEYVPNMYGEDTGSDLHRDLGTDRFLVEWRLRDPGVEAALAQGLAMDGGLLARAPVVTNAAEDVPLGRPLSLARTVLVEIPDDILQVRARSPEEAWQWRQHTRRAFRHYLDRGYVVAGWHRRLDPNRSAYVLAQP